MHTVTGKQQKYTMSCIGWVQVHGLGASEPTCTPLAMPLRSVILLEHRYYYDVGTVVY